MFFALASWGFAWRRTYHFVSDQLNYQFPSFGFEANGTFSIELETKAEAKINIFLMRYEELQAKSANGISFAESCDEHNLRYLAELNYTSTKLHTWNSWNGTITKRDVYWIYLINCYTNRSNTKMTIDFQNPDSFLDYRDDHRGIVCFILCCLYIILALIWLANGLLHLNFMIPLHTLTTIMVITKAICLGLEAKQWELERIGLELSKENTLLSYVFFIVHYSLFWAIPVLIFSGWCTYNDKMNKDEVASTFLGIILMLVGVRCSDSEGSMGDTLLAMSFILVGFLWYLHQAAASLMLITKVIEFGDHPEIQNKLSLVTGYLEGIGSIIFVMFAGAFAASSSDVWPVVQTLTYEMAALAVIVVQMRHFLLKDEHAGVVYSEENEQQTEVLLRILEDPNEKEFVVLSNNL